jgi:DNA processing protein
MDASERLSRLALAHVGFLRPREKLELVDMLGGAAPLFGLSLGELAELLGRRPHAAAWDPAGALELAAQTERRLTAGSMGSIFYWDPAYPPLLRAIYDPPSVLFWRGVPPRHDVLTAAIVGTRLPTGAARKAAFGLGFELARAGVGVVSGLARGIDSEAHDGCLAGRGYTVAVLGSGVDIVSPAGSAATARALLMAGGTILSEYPPGTQPMKHHFPARNRIISGMSRAVVVVQAPERSGALITAEYALEQGRDLAVHAQGTGGTAGAGARALADAGAPVIHGAAALLAEWGMLPRAGLACGVQADGGEAGDMRAGGAPAGNTAAAGAALARRLRAEVDGSCVLRDGETYWRG